MNPLSAVLADVEAESKEWCFERSQPVTEYEWVAIFRRWVQEADSSEVIKKGDV